MIALGNLPACPRRVPRAASEATIDDHAWARIDGMRIVDPVSEAACGVYAYPKIPRRVAWAAMLLGVGCRAVDLGNWLAGGDVHRWFAVAPIGPKIGAEH